MKTLRRIAALVLAVLAVAAPRAFSEEPRPEPPQEAVASLGADGVQRVEILAGSYFFKPARIIVKVNVPVELKVRKEAGVAPHNIVLKAPDAGVEFDVELKTEPRTIAFTPTRTGEYPIYCSKRFLFFASHRDRGMEGVLDVRE